MPAPIHTMSSSIVSIACACMRLIPAICSNGGSSNGSFGCGSRGIAHLRRSRSVGKLLRPPTMCSHGRAAAHHLRRRPRRRAARPLDGPAPEEVPRPRAAGGARQPRCSTSRAASSPTRRASRAASRATGGSTTTSSTRSRSCRRRSASTELDVTPDHLRRDPARLLEAEGAARRHGRQPHRGVDLLPEHAPPLLRPDVLRARRQRPRAALRAGLQRLDDRRVVRRRRQGPPDPAVAAPALGRRARAPPRSSRSAAQGLLRGHVPREPVPARPAVDPRQGAATGTRSSPACQDTGTVVCMHIGSCSKMPTTSPDAPFIVSSTLTFSNAMGSMLDYIFSGTLERFPRPHARVQRGPGRLDALRDRARRQAVGGAQRQLLRHRAPRTARRAT